MPADQPSNLIQVDWIRMHFFKFSISVSQPISTGRILESNLDAINLVHTVAAERHSILKAPRWNEADRHTESASVTDGSLAESSLHGNKARDEAINA